MSIDVKGRDFVVGEKPRPTPFKFRSDDGALDTQWNGWTFIAYCSNNTLPETTVTCTNNGDGTGAINWPTTDSIFVAPGTMKVKLRATNGNYVEKIGTITYKVRSE